MASPEKDQKNAKGYQILPPEKQSRPYEKPNMEAGHDGNPPVFEATRDFIGRGGKREPVDGPTNVNSTRLSMLKARGIIDDRQFRAGDRLFRDWYLARIDPTASNVMVGNGSSGGGCQLPNDVKVDAMKRHGAAMEAIGMAWPIVEAVCCFDLRLDQAASRLRVDPRRATGRLEIGLDMLASHYSVVDAAKRRQRDRDR